MQITIIEDGKINSAPVELADGDSLTYTAGGIPSPILVGNVNALEHRLASALKALGEARLHLDEAREALDVIAGAKTIREMRELALEAGGRPIEREEYY